MLPLSEYEALRNRPVRPHIMYQGWRSLLFLHYSCSPEEIQPHLPPGLEVDTFDGKAWVGLVPFRMQDIRPRYLPGVPGHSAFPETNVRTYVHRGGKEPGVWFFSLDAASPLACRVARGLWRLPYHEADMRVVDESEALNYSCTRESSGCRNRVEATIGEALPQPEPGSLEFFLVERYLLYAFKPPHLYTGRVWHEPYSLRAATLGEMDDSLIEAAGLRARPIESVLFCPGVDVRIYPIQRVATQALV